MKQIFDLLVYVFPFALAVMAPLLITALGGLFSERSGVVNIGLEGLMLVGGFAYAMFANYLYPVMGRAAIWVGLPVAMAAGVLVSLLHAFACVNMGANQVISGTAINMLAAALTVFFARLVTGSGNVRIPDGGFSKFNVPRLSEIRVIGDIFFKDTYPTTWIIIAVLLCSMFLLYKTSFGLRLRACGENPHAADAAGINVYRMRYAGVMFSGAFAGLGGAAYLACFSNEFAGTMSGLGFLALAALIFGQWKPLGILGATMFFGLASTIGNMATAIPTLRTIPEIYLKIFPYVATLLVLVFFSRSSAAPRAAGEPYVMDKR